MKLFAVTGRAVRRLWQLTCRSYWSFLLHLLLIAEDESFQAAIASNISYKLIHCFVEHFRSALPMHITFLGWLFNSGIYLERIR